MKNELTNKEYDELVKKKTPNSTIFINCVKAFVSGGLICVLGQILFTVFKNLGIDLSPFRLFFSARF